MTLRDAAQEHVLLTPGPTPLHPAAQRALGREMLGHIDPEVFALDTAIQEGLRRMYNAKDGTFTALLSRTSSLGMETGFANLVEPGDEVLVCVNGSFGQRMAEMMAALRRASAPSERAAGRGHPRRRRVQPA